MVHISTERSSDGLRRLSLAGCIFQGTTDFQGIAGNDPGEPGFVYAAEIHYLYVP